MNNRCILVVDDSPIMRKVTRMTLGKMPGLDVKEASNGLEALEFLLLNSVDLMILDLNMPEMGGKEVLELLQTNPKFKKLPVIILTTCDDIHNRVSMQNLGASAYLNKPVNPAELAERVRRLLIIKKISESHHV